MTLGPFGIFFESHTYRPQCIEVISACGPLISFPSYINIYLPFLPKETISIPRAPTSLSFPALPSHPFPYCDTSSFSISQIPRQSPRPFRLRYVSFRIIFIFSRSQDRAFSTDENPPKIKGLPLKIAEIGHAGNDDNTPDVAVRFSSRSPSPSKSRPTVTQEKPMNTHSRHTAPLDDEEEEIQPHASSSPPILSAQEDDIHSESDHVNPRP